MPVRTVAVILGLLLDHACCFSTSSPPRQATRVRVSHILVDSEDMAQTVVAALEEGSDFATVAESLSTCDSKANGGDLGWISPGLMVPEFDFAAFTFPPGEVAKVKSDFGWHVLRVAEASYVAAEKASALVAGVAPAKFSQ